MGTGKRKSTASAARLASVNSAGGGAPDVVVSPAQSPPRSSTASPSREPRPPIEYAPRSEHSDALRTGDGGGSGSGGDMRPSGSSGASTPTSERMPKVTAREGRPEAFLVGTETHRGADTHTVYIIEVTHGDFQYTVGRRYREFRTLHRQLWARFHHVLRIPPFPPKRWFHKMDPEFVEQRRAELEHYVRMLMTSPRVLLSEEFGLFLAEFRNGAEYRRHVAKLEARIRELETAHGATLSSASGLSAVAAAAAHSVASGSMPRVPSESDLAALEARKGQNGDELWRELVSLTHLYQQRMAEIAQMQQSVRELTAAQSQAVTEVVELKAVLEERDRALQHAEVQAREHESVVHEQRKEITRLGGLLEHAGSGAGGGGGGGGGAGDTLTYVKQLRDMEEQLRRKDDELRRVKEDVQKNNNIAALIHSLSSSVGAAPASPARGAGAHQGAGPQGGGGVQSGGIAASPGGSSRSSSSMNIGRGTGTGTGTGGGHAAGGPGSLSHSFSFNSLGSNSGYGGAYGSYSNGAGSVHGSSTSGGAVGPMSPLAPASSSRTVPTQQQQQQQHAQHGPHSLSHSLSGSGANTPGGAMSAPMFDDGLVLHTGDASPYASPYASSYGHSAGQPMGWPVAAPVLSGSSSPSPYGAQPSFSPAPQ